jgi:hypothetical protein
MRLSAAILQISKAFSVTAGFRSEMLRQKSPELNGIPALTNDAGAVKPHQSRRTSRRLIGRRDPARFAI